MLPTVFVQHNERYAGNGSKQSILPYTNANVIMQVLSNVSGGHFGENAIIENLIIDGQNQPGTVGILLQNVYNCIIRNLTILNCDIGIKVENTGSYALQSNRIEHVRMSNVSQGIVFASAAGNSGDFRFTVIEDVGIKLKNIYMGGVGIQIGVSGGSVVKLYNSFIKATVWLGDIGSGCAMKVYGELKYSLVMLIAESPNAQTGAVRLGVDIVNSQPNAVFNNQSFMLTYAAPIITAVNLSSGHDIVTEIL